MRPESTTKPDRIADAGTGVRPAPILPGLGGLLRGELHRWLGTRILLHTAVWTLAVTGPLWYATTQTTDIGWRGFDLLLHLWWIALPLGSIAVAQNAVIEERTDGTLPWILSNPVSRPAFVLSKIISNVLGVALPAVVLQAALAWVLLPSLDPRAGLPIRQPDAGRYLATVGIEVLIVAFFVTLSVFVGAIFRSRGPVAGIGLGAWILAWNAPASFVENLTIGGLVSGELAGAPFKPLAEYLVFARPLEPASALAWTAIWTVFFVVGAVLVLRREQF